MLELSRATWRRCRPPLPLALLTVALLHAQAARAQQDALTLARKKRLELSRLQARAAASGFGAADPTVLDLTGEVAQYGTLDQQLARYGGEVRAEDRRASAAGARAQGAAALRNAHFNAAGTVLGGVSSMFRRYG